MLPRTYSFHFVSTPKNSKYDGRGAISFSHRLASFASRRASKNLSLYSSLPRRAVTSVAARAQQSRGDQPEVAQPDFNGRGDLLEWRTTSEYAARVETEPINGIILTRAQYAFSLRRRSSSYD
ncbi:uncharacterized protein LOC112342729 [Selaginella moellendorffii]|uniref:uncharacterized protein LOC112342729 n=1 Tax=Selaginella moellendorffii TaxID=88036 RepID=UPI000D1C87D1|nr:uncharacterized protein LOC112342729 [Selaginella moellendorffii]|eukprot:XP_024520755.1 uncharacterized protein LOC112342729 [Selaginella moellendorffii]